MLPVSFRLIALGLLAVLVVAPAAPADDKELTEAEKEVKSWTGTYTVTHYETDGVKTKEEQLKKMKVVLDGAKGSFYVGEDVTTCTVTVDPSKAPREIDSVYTNGPAR